MTNSRHQTNNLGPLPTRHVGVINDENVKVLDFDLDHESLLDGVPSFTDSDRERPRLPSRTLGREGWRRWFPGGRVVKDVPKDHRQKVPDERRGPGMFPTKLLFKLRFTDTVNYVLRVPPFFTSKEDKNLKDRVASY